MQLMINTKFSCFHTLELIIKQHTLLIRIKNDLHISDI